VNEAVIKRAQNGDHEAFLDLVRQYDRQIMSIVYRFSGNLYDREDLYQEVFLQCYKSIASFRFESSFKTWLTRLALNSCIDYMNRQPPTAEARELSSEETDWEQQAKLQAIHEALNQLQGSQRVCFHMYYIEGWTVKEIMALLNCGEGTVKSHMSRAREKVKTNTRVLQWRLNSI